MFGSQGTLRRDFPSGFADGMFPRYSEYEKLETINDNPPRLRDQQGHPSKRTQSPIVTGTSVLAIKYKDGVMMAADTLGSYGSLARYMSLERIRAAGDSTIIGASGEYSDFQYIMTLLDDLIIRDGSTDDGSSLKPNEIHSYLTRVLYNRRNKFDPLWNQLVIAGFRDGKSFLGACDLLGTSYEEDLIATGYGAYIAMPLMRKAYKPDLNPEEAQKILEDCMRALFYRDARTINKIQIAKITSEGSAISVPYALRTDWTIGEISSPSGFKI